MTTEQNTIPLNILLAEDDLDDRIFFEKALNELPLVTKITTVYDGEALMEYLYGNMDHLPDILFLDLSMPRKNGIECLSEIMENRLMKNMPVIMFSTLYSRDKNYEKNMINTLYSIGAQDYIRKPADFELLKKVIYHALLTLLKKKILDETG